MGENELKFDIYKCLSRPEKMTEPSVTKNGLFDDKNTQEEDKIVVGD